MKKRNIVLNFKAKYNFLCIKMINIIQNYIVSKYYFLFVLILTQIYHNGVIGYTKNLKTDSLINIIFFNTSPISKQFFKSIT